MSQILSTEFEQLKILLTADARGAQIVLDYEDRDVLVFGDYYGAQNIGLGKNQMITFATNVREAIFLKDTFQRFP